MKHNNGKFKKGQHWRAPKLYWEKEWLYQEYIVKQRSASEIAAEFDCSENNILAFLHKLGIPTRTISEARKVKYWGSYGSTNPMYEKTGSQNPNWKGGITAERQAFYSSREWASAVSAVWQRDEAKCYECGVKSKRATMHIHHLVSFACGHLRCELSNLMLLCRDCHEWVHSSENSEGHYINE